MELLFLVSAVTFFWRVSKSDLVSSLTGTRQSVITRCDEPQKASQWSYLPPEIRELILGYVGCKKSIPRVCKEWNQLFVKTVSKIVRSHEDTIQAALHAATGERTAIIDGPENGQCLATLAFDHLLTGHFPWIGIKTHPKSRGYDVSWTKQQGNIKFQFSPCAKETPFYQLVEGLLLSREVHIPKSGHVETNIYKCGDILRWGIRYAILQVFAICFTVEPAKFFPAQFDALLMLAYESRQGVKDYAQITPNQVALSFEGRVGQVVIEEWKHMIQDPRHRARVFHSFTGSK